MATSVEPRSRRGKRLRGERKLTPLEQIRTPGGPADAQLTGAWAYFLRPEGATIRDALALYPNGGVPDIDDARRRARFAKNVDYSRTRQGYKGHKYLGSKLTEAAVKELVATIQSNREDEILFVEDEIADCEVTIENADRPEIRDQAKKRRNQFQRRLEYLQEDLDPEAMTAELNEIARAQQLANVDPNVLRVLQSMIGEVNENMRNAIAKFQTRRPSGGGEDDEGNPVVSRPARMGGSVDIDDGFADGKDFIDADE